MLRGEAPGVLAGPQRLEGIEVAGPISYEIGQSLMWLTGPALAAQTACLLYVWLHSKAAVR